MKTQWQSARNSDIGRNQEYADKSIEVEKDSKRFCIARRADSNEVLNNHLLKLIKINDSVSILHTFISSLNKY